MGNSNIKEFHNENTIVKSAIQMKNFFAQYYDSPDKMELLKYIPIAVNYEIGANGTAQDNSMFGVDPPKFYKPRKSLWYQMQYHFCVGCQIVISKDFNRKMREFKKMTKTESEILHEHYFGA